MSQKIEKEVYNVWINQCWECNDLSQVNVRNWDTLKEMEKIENAIKKKYLLSDDGWGNEEYKEIIKPKKDKEGELIAEGNITINLRKYIIYAKVERHKCCRCGGNY